MKGIAEEGGSLDVASLRGAALPGNHLGRVLAPSSHPGAQTLFAASCARARRRIPLSCLMGPPGPALGKQAGSACLPDIHLI